MQNAEQTPLNIGDELRSAMGTTVLDDVAAFLAFHKKEMLAKAAHGSTEMDFDIGLDILDYNEGILTRAVARHGLFLTDFYSGWGSLSFTLHWL